MSTVPAGRRPPGPAPLTFTVQGRRITLPPISDALAWEWAAAGSWAAALPAHLPPDDVMWWMRQLRDPGSPLTLRATYQVWCEISRHVYGMHWWAATRLAQSCEHAWMDFGGWAVRRGFDPGTAPLDRRLAAAWAWRTENASDQQDYAAMRSQVFDPPRIARGRHERPGWSAADQHASFAAFIPPPPAAAPAPAVPAR